MSILSIANLSHAYGTNVVLDGFNCTIERGQKIGLVGRNGCGKTTLMKILCGTLSADSGAVQLQRGARVGYLAQDPDFDPTDTVRDAAECAFAQLHALHQQAHELYDQMATATGDDLDKLLKKQARIDGEIEAAGGYAIDHKIEATLHGLGFEDAQFSLPVSKLSGGQKGRLGLARLLLEAPDVLLLDEPTNHLDIAGRQWLEDFLADEYTGAVVVVSHDRWLLDRVVDRIVEVDYGRSLEYPGNYQKYVELRRERQLTLARQHDKQRDHIRREQQFISRYKAGQRSKQARGRESRLDRFKQDQMVDRPPELDVMRLQLPPASRSGDQVLVAEGISKAYDDLCLFKAFDLNVQRGDRIGIIGPNGTGKTTLVRCLLGDLELDDGEVRIGSRLSVGYYRQLHEHLDMELTIWEYLQSVIVALDGQTHASEQQARDLAGAFLFSGSEQDKRLSEVSGGERSRAVLAGLVAGAHNLLVLDEPSNHLDIPSAERLEQALSIDGGYDGTLILISHDRALLQSTCNKLIIFDGDSTVRLFEGKYRAWVDRAAQRDAESAPPPPSPPRPRKPRKEKVKQSASASNPLGKISLKRLEEQIESLEHERDDLDRQLLDPEVYRDGDRCRKIKERRDAIDSELDPIETEWTRRVEDDS